MIGLHIGVVSEAILGTLEVRFGALCMGCVNLIFFIATLIRVVYIRLIHVDLWVYTYG